MLETYWSSELSQLQEMQKREYREWVTKVHEDMVRVSSGKLAGSIIFKEFSKPYFLAIFHLILVLVANCLATVDRLSIVLKNVSVIKSNM